MAKCHWRIMKMKEFKIDGCISVPEDITEEEFWNQFIDLIESKQWLFGGGIHEYTDDTIGTMSRKSAS